MRLAIFDFDGTITTKDSFADFIFYSHGTPKTLLGILVVSPILVLYVLKIMPNWKAKQKVFAYFYKGWEKKDFEAAAERYIRERLPHIIRPAALKRLEWHKKEGHRIVIVSASFENYLKHWCEAFGFELLATKVEIKDGTLTGQFASKNCFGEEKVERLKETYDLNDFEFIYAYGDSKGDMALAKISDEFHYRPFILTPDIRSPRRV